MKPLEAVEVESDIEVESRVDVVSDVKIETGVEVESEVDVESGVDVEPEFDVGSDAGGVRSGVDAESGGEVEPGVTSLTEPDSESCSAKRLAFLLDFSLFTPTPFLLVPIT